MVKTCTLTFFPFSKTLAHSWHLGLDSEVLDIWGSNNSREFFASTDVDWASELAVAVALHLALALGVGSSHRHVPSYKNIIGSSSNGLGNQCPW